MIELLVVIGILALLAAILLPTVQKSFNRADQAQARLAVKGLVSSWQAYFTEYNRWPSSLTDVSTGIAMHAEQVELFTLRFSDSDVENPKRIIFLKEISDDVLNEYGDYVDPWGHAYQIRYDVDFDSIIDRHGSNVRANVIAWSWGPDGKDSSAAEAEDNVNSWE